MKIIRFQSLTVENDIQAELYKFLFMKKTMEISQGQSKVQCQTCVYLIFYVLCLFLSSNRREKAKKQ